MSGSTIAPIERGKENRKGDIRPPIQKYLQMQKNHHKNQIYTFTKKWGGQKFHYYQKIVLNDKKMIHQNF